MPAIPSGNTNAPVLAIADRAVDIITGGAGHRRQERNPMIQDVEPVHL
jgi:choline dehydrogenase